MSHQGRNGMTKLAKSLGMTLTGKFKRCIVCAQGKAKKTAFFKDNQIHRFARNECWHLDCQGPFRTPTRLKNRYALTAVEDFSGMIVVWMLPKRSHQWACLDELLTWSFTQTGSRVRLIRADGEWIAPASVTALQRQWGFEIKATNPDTPQQNGLVESVGGVIMDRARTTLLYAHLPDSYVGDAISSVVHTYNFELGRNGIRRDAFYQRVEPREHLRTFGCLCFV